MRLKGAIALACLVVGFNANAALQTNADGASGSSLFLTVYNGVDKSFAIDLGVNAVTTDFSTFSFSQNFASQITAALGAITSSFVYSVVAVSTDILNTGIWTSHQRNDLLPYDINS